MYKVEEKDPKTLSCACIFLLLMYRKGNVSTLYHWSKLIDKIEDGDKDEENRFYCLIWLSWALSETEQFEREIALFCDKSTK